MLAPLTALSLLLGIPHLSGDPDGCPPCDHNDHWASFDLREGVVPSDGVLVFDVRRYYDQIEDEEAVDALTVTVTDGTTTYDGTLAIVRDFLEWTPSTPLPPGVPLSVDVEVDLDALGPTGWCGEFDGESFPLEVDPAPSAALPPFEPGRTVHYNDYERRLVENYVCCGGFEVSEYHDPGPEMCGKVEVLEIPDECVLAFDYTNAVLTLDLTGFSDALGPAGRANVSARSVHEDGSRGAWHTVRIEAQRYHSDPEKPPGCIALEFVHHTTGETLETEPICFTHEEVADVGRHPIAGVGTELAGICASPPLMCSSPELAPPEDPAWIDEVCRAFPEPESPLGVTPLGGGCQLIGSGPPTGSALWLFALVALRRRRRAMATTTPPR